MVNKNYYVLLLPTLFLMMLGIASALPYLPNTINPIPGDPSILIISHSPASPLDTQGITFTADYIPSSGLTYTGNCTLNLSATPQTLWNMTYDADTGLHTFSRGPLAQGNYNYNITCETEWRNNSLNVRHYIPPPPPPPNSCFVAGTLVAMADGTSKKIEDVHVGDNVLGRNGFSAEVYELENPIREGYYALKLADGTTLKVTSEHPLYARGANGEKGWYSFNPSATYEDARMHVGDISTATQVQTLTGWIDITSYSYVEGEVQTYNLKSVERNTFYADRVLAHNKGGGGGGGGNYCFPDYSECGSWTACLAGNQTRTCTDINACGGAYPLENEEWQACTGSCFDRVQNQDEEGVDCGGSCDLACETSEGDENITVIPNPEVIPLIVQKPITATPGEPLVIEIINEGVEAWNDLEIEIDGKRFSLQDSIFGGESKQIEADVSIGSVFSHNSYEVTLYHQDTTLDTKTLTIEHQWPEYGAYVDTDKEGEPRIYILLNNKKGNAPMESVEAEVTLSRGGINEYFDIVGSYDVPVGDTLVKSVRVPAEYLNEGNYEVKALFYQQGNYVTESASYFQSGDGGFNWAPLLIIILSAVGVFLLYIIMDMIYNKRTIVGELRSLTTPLRK